MSVHTNCGWVISSPKHIPIGQQKIFLGLTVNLISIEFEIPDKKLEKFFLILGKIQSNKIIFVRLLTSFLGVIKLL